MNRLIFYGCLCFAALILSSCAGSVNKIPEGFLEGHLTIVGLKPVELADDSTPTIPPEIYAQYPLIVLTAETQKQVSRITADTNGNYHVALPPGSYILDAEGRAPKRVRATPQPFMIVSNETVRIDMDIDTGIR